MVEERCSSRGDFGRRVCHEFDIRDDLEHLQLASCLQALRIPAGRRDGILLPAVGPRFPAGPHPELLAAKVRLTREVPQCPEQALGLQVVLVGNKAQSRVWSGLIESEHRLGLTTFAGRQFRYLVSSVDDWMGAVAPAALRVRAQDPWMARNNQQRGQILERFVVLWPLYSVALESSTVGSPGWGSRGGSGISPCGSKSLPGK